MLGIVQIALQEHAEMSKDRSTLKTCNVCKERKPTGEFTKYGNAYRICKPCLEAKLNARKSELKRLRESLDDEYI